MSNILLHCSAQCRVCFRHRMGICRVFPPLNWSGGRFFFSCRVMLSFPVWGEGLFVKNIPLHDAHFALFAQFYAVCTVCAVLCCLRSLRGFVQTAVFARFAQIWWSIMCEHGWVLFAFAALVSNVGNQDWSGDVHSQMMQAKPFDVSPAKQNCRLRCLVVVSSFKEGRVVVDEAPPRTMFVGHVGN